jgi:serine/threonine-protein kinase
VGSGLEPAGAELATAATEPKTDADTLDQRSETAPRLRPRRAAAASVVVGIASLSIVGAGLWGGIAHKRPRSGAPPPTPARETPTEIAAPIVPPMERAEPAPTPAPETAPARPRRSAAPVAGKPAVLKIDVEPWGDVSIDGRKVGQTPLRPLEVAAGLHRVSVSNPASGAQEKRVSVSSGEVLRLHFHLASP